MGSHHVSSPVGSAVRDIELIVPNGGLAVKFPKSLTLTLKRKTFLCPRNELKWRFEQAKDVGRGTRSAPGIPRVVGPEKAVARSIWHISR